MDIDSNPEDGIPDGEDYAAWTVLDSISILDDNDFSPDAEGQVSEFGYGNIVFVRNLAIGGDNILIPTAITTWDTLKNQ